MYTKQWYQSKTIWLAVAQGVAGILIAYFSSNPVAATVGYGALLKSALDMYLRFTSTQTIL